LVVVVGLSDSTRINLSSSTLFDNVVVVVVVDDDDDSFDDFLIASRAVASLTRCRTLLITVYHANLKDLQQTSYTNESIYHCQCHYCFIR
jgi:hypothetical protein